MSKMIDIKMIKPKLAISEFVKTAVCVRNPGPIADVAMRNAAAMIGDLKSAVRLNVFFIMLQFDMIIF